MKLRHIITSVLITIFMLFSLNASAESTPLKDSIITTKIKSKLALDKAVSAFDVKVSTENGVVTLTGQVDSDAQAARAIEIARTTEDVKNVNANHLFIKESQQAMTDTAITALIKGMFLKEKLVNGIDIPAGSISVNTNNGVVSLTGTAQNQKQIDNAIAAAKAIDGVKKVDSYISIQ